jgi:hypothetical protein
MNERKEREDASSKKHRSCQQLHDLERGNAARPASHLGVSDITHLVMKTEIKWTSYFIL